MTQENGMAGLISSWVDWAKAFLNSEQIEMSDTLSRAFITCSMGSNFKSSIPQEVQGMFQYKMADKRAQVIGLSIEPWALIFLVSLVNSPGSIVMYLNALKYYQLTHQGKIISMDSLVDCFPNGYVAEDRLSELWDMQKVDSREYGSDNMLDVVPTNISLEMLAAVKEGLKK